MLRLLLYLTCFISINWLAFLFTGPAVLKWLIHSYSNNQLIASDIKVTPNLDVKIGRLDYSLRGEDKLAYAEGFARSVSMRWSVFGDEPLIELRLGPTFLEGHLLADNMNLFTPTFKDIDLENILFNIGVENLKTQQLATEKVSLSIEGIYHKELKLITGLHGILPSFKFGPNDSLTSGDFIVKLNELDLNLPVHEQNFVIEISSDKILDKQRGISLSDLKASVGLIGADIDFHFEAQELELTELGHSFGKVNVEGQYNMEEFLRDANIRLSSNSISNGVIDSPILEIDISNYEPSTPNFAIVGDFEPFDLSVGGNFIGKIPAGNFEIDLRLNSAESEVYAVPKFTFNSMGSTEVSGGADIIIKIEPLGSVFDCMVKPCKIFQLYFEYKVYFANEWVSGTSTCTTAACDFYSLSHSLKTSNTAELFTLINQSAIFNPVYAFYFYNVFNTGEKLGNGHNIKFN